MLVEDFDVILLDLMLLELNGLEVCWWVCEVKNMLIIMMMVCDFVIDWVFGLDYGVDDYIVKLFVIEELFVCLWVLLWWIDLESE